MSKNILEYLTNLWYAIINKKHDRECDNMSKIISSLEEKARDILFANDMLSQLPINLLKLARLNNIEVYYKDMPSDVSGAIKYDKEEDKFKILIKRNMPKTRQRFTLAHELSHYFLHNSLLKSEEIYIDTLYRNNNIKEEQVDYLAGALLIEENMVRELYKLNPSISELATLFGVSDSAMKVRLEILGVL